MGKRRGSGRQWRWWTEAEARRALAELDASRESAAGFAKRTGISAQRLAYWRKRLAKPAKAAFVAVALPGPTPVRWIEIAAFGVVVRVGEDADIGDVARLVEAIGQRVGGGC